MDRKQVERLGIQQEQQAIQQRQRGIVGLAEKLVAGVCLLVKVAASVLHESLGQVRKNLVEDPPSKAIAQFLRKGLRVESELIQERKRLASHRFARHWQGWHERRGSEEQPEIPQRDQVILAQRFRQFDFVVVARAGVGCGAVQPPVLSVGQNGPRHLVLLQRPYDADSGHVVRTVSIKVILPIQRPVPLVSEQRRDGGRVAGAIRRTQQKVGLVILAQRVQLETQGRQGRLHKLGVHVLGGQLPHVTRVRQDFRQALVQRPQVRVPDRKRPCVSQSGLQEIVAEQATVVELVLGPFRQPKGVTNPLKLGKRIGSRTAHPFKHTKMHPGWMPPVKRNQAMAYSDTCTARSARLNSLLHQHEVQGVEVTGGDNQQGVSGLISKRCRQRLSQLDRLSRGFKAVHLQRWRQTWRKSFCSNPIDAPNQVLETLSDPEAARRLLDRFARVIAQDAQQLLDPSAITRRLYGRNVDPPCSTNQGASP